MKKLINRICAFNRKIKSNIKLWFIQDVKCKHQYKHRIINYEHYIANVDICEKCGKQKNLIITNK